MNIGFDIDDTITNSSEVFVKYAIEYNRMKKINYSIRKNFNGIYSKQRCN